MVLELADKEQEVLKTVLDSYEHELREEIVRTDDREFKHLLREEEDVVKGLMRRVS